MSARYYLNALDYLLLTQMLRVECNKTKESLEYGDRLDIATKVGSSIEIINRIFNYSSPSKDKGNGFNRSSIDPIIKSIDRVEADTWEEFQRLYFENSRIDYPKGKIPNNHLVSIKTREEIFDFVNNILLRLYPDKDFSRYRFHLDRSVNQEPSTKFKSLFLNTKWYFYYFFENRGNPKLGRLILRIGNSSDKVVLEHFDNSEDNNFQGNVTMDFGQSYLIFNMKTLRTNENDLHVKVDANSGKRPEIMLGFLSNIGLNFPSLVHGHILLENISELDDDLIRAMPIGVGDNEFKKTHWTIKKYFKYKDNVLSTLEPKIYSKEKLGFFIEKQEKVRPIKKLIIRQQEKLKAIISHPKFSLAEGEREKYFLAREKVANFLAEKDFEIFEDPSIKSNLKIPPPLDARFYYQRVEECDVFIMLYFDKVISNSLAELAWAYQLGKKIIIFIPDRKYIPRTFWYEKSLSNQYFEVQNPDEAADWFIEMFPILFRDELGG